MHFRIFKVIATSGFLTALECPKFLFDQGSGPRWRAHKVRQTPSWFKRNPTSKVKGRGWERRSGKRREERGRDEDGSITQILGSAPELQIFPQDFLTCNIFLVRC